MASGMASSSILSATSEILLDDDQPSLNVQNGMERGTKQTAASPQFQRSAAAQSMVGSSNVGSRLAGGAVGSRLANSGMDTGSSSKVEPRQTSFLNSSSMSARNTGPTTGFGRAADPSNSNNKLSNLSMQEVQQVAADKAGQVKSWSVKTYKCTKQILSEKLGRGSRTIDLEVEAKIEILRDTKRKYEQLLTLTKALANHFSSIIQTQKVLASVFTELSSKSQELQEEFQYNAESQLVVAKSGEILLSAINFFIGNINTLCTKTMEDSLLTVAKYESARVSYDAYKSELDSINALPRTGSNIMKQANAEASFSTYKDAYEKLRADVGVKLQFLDENRVKVMQKNLLLFHNAIAAYFAGNQQQLDGTLRQFNIKVAGKDPNAASFLETH